MSAAARVVARLGVFVLLGGLAGAGAPGCARRAGAGATGPGSGGAAETGQLAELRAQVAREPADRRARVALGRLEREAGRPGAALRQLDAALALGEGRVRAELAALHAARGRARAARAEIHRYRDLERAAALDPELRPGLEAERRAALTDAGLAAWAAGDEPGARALWAKAPGPEALAVVQAVDDPERAPLLLVGAAAARTFRLVGLGAWPLLDAYVRRGGGDEEVLAAWATARALRGGDAAGELPGSSDRCAAVPAVVAEAARAWLRGERDAFIDDDLDRELAGLGEGRSACPAWLTPTLARIGGDRQALAAAKRAPLGAVPGWARALLILEGVDPGAGSDDAEAQLARRELLRRSGRTLPRLDDEPIAHAQGEGLGAWRSETGPEGPALGRLFARWRAVQAAIAAEAPAAAESAPTVSVQMEPEAPAPTATPSSTPAPLGEPTVDTLLPAAGCPDDADEAAARAALIAAVRADAEGGFAQARDFVDAALAPTCRALVVIDLYTRLGDTARALAFTDELLALEPSQREALALAVRALASAGDSPRLRLVLEQAEYFAARRGAPSVAAAMILVELGQPIDAIAAGRSALRLAQGSVRREALEVLVVAAWAAARPADAEAALGTLIAEADAAAAGPSADLARRRLRARFVAAGVALPAPTALPALEILRATPREEALAAGGQRLAAWVALNPDDADAQARAATDVADVTQALRFAPWSIALRRAAAAVEKERAGKVRWLGELVYFGLVSAGARGQKALGLGAEVAMALGEGALAQGLRAEMRWK